MVKRTAFWLNVLSCPRCGGMYLGDGLNSPLVCENHSEPPEDVEPDSGPYPCQEIDCEIVSENPEIDEDWRKLSELASDIDVGGSHGRINNR